MRPGTSAEPFASIVVVALPVSRSFAFPIAVMRPLSATIVSASRIGFSIAPDSIRPMLRITSLVGLDVIGGSVMGHATILS